MGGTLTEPMSTLDTLRAIADAFTRHDLDAIMSYFAASAGTAR